jgi:hypothetical protein
MSSETLTIAARRLPLAGAVLASLLVCGGLQAQSGKKMKGFIVYGEGFSFMVKEPDGWRSDIGKIASKYGANVVFLPSAQESRKLDVTIRVRVNQKQDENTIEDLNYDLQGYREEYPDAKFSELDVTHAEYGTFAKLVFVPKQFYEYVAYVNPGRETRFTFSVAMSRRNSPAMDAELNAFRTVLRSVIWLTSSVITKP